MSGYIRLIPVGPLSTTQESKGYQKSDVYLYGLSLAQSKRGYADTSTGRTSTDWGVPFGAIGTGAADFGQKITSWGTFDNPWVIKTLTNPDVPDFTGAINGVTYFPCLYRPVYQVLRNGLHSYNRQGRTFAGEHRLIYKINQRVTGLVAITKVA